MYVGYVMAKDGKPDPNPKGDEFTPEEEEHYARYAKFRRRFATETEAERATREEAERLEREKNKKPLSIF